MAGINVSIDNQKFTAAKFAKEIKLEDVLKNIKNIDKCIIEEMFNSVAGEDRVLQGTELEAFFKKVEEASGDDKNLSPTELENFARSRVKGFSAKFAASARNSLFREFIKQLFVTNDQKLKQEDAAKQNEPKPVKPEDKFYENGKLVKKIIYKEDGTTVEQQFKNGKLSREITKTPDGKIKKDKTIDKDGNKTFHIPVKDGGEKFVIYDKDNKKIGEGTVDKNGYKTTNYLDENGKVVKKVNEDKNWLDVYTYDKDGKCTERRVTSDGTTGVHKYFYDENGNQTKEIVTYPDGSVSTTFFDEKGITKEVTKEKSGRTITTTFKDGKVYQPVRKVEVDEKGKKYITDYTYADENAHTASKQVDKDGNSKVLSVVTRKFDKEGNTLEETQKDGNGRLVRVSTFKNGECIKEKYYFGHDGSVETTTYGKNTTTRELHDKDGKLIKTTISAKNAKGETTKEVIKDGNGNIIETTTYTENGYIVRDGSGKILRSSEKSKTSKGDLYTHKDGSGNVTNTELHFKNGFIYTQYRDNKPICSEEYNRDTDKTIYKDAQGNEIDQAAYIQLRKSANLIER